jgi:glutamate dehydrogenase (NAD(P)+)
VRQVSKNVGPVQDVPAPDVMTNPQHMVWILDEYEKLAGGHYPGFITGKPVEVGGSLGRTEATGYGVIYTVREALKRFNIPVKGVRATAQGFGNVAQYAAKKLIELGGMVVAVACWDNDDHCAYTFRKLDGIDVDFLLSITDRFGTIKKEKAEAAGYDVLEADAWLEQEAEILIPAALENQITGDNVNRIHAKARIVAEGANGPTTPEADAVLKERGIFVIPDFLANAGGVTCSYFEQVQCNTNFFWPKDEVLDRLDQKMTRAFNAVADLAAETGEYMRDAAYMIAIQRVATACHLRGWA